MARAGSLPKAEPLTPRGLDVAAAARLRAMIITGRYAPGEHLVEEQLSEWLGVSRATVRGAFRLLHHEGLVEYRRNRGVFVLSFGAEDVWEVYTLRDALESRAAGLAAGRIGEAGRRQLETILEAMRKAVAAGDRDAAMETDWQFHRAVMEMSGHRRMQRIYAQLEAQTRMFLALSDTLHADLGHMLPLHEPLAGAIAAGEVARAQELAGHHTESDGRALIRHLEERAVLAEQ
ncbi:GntR family transcriptional regulator [Geminicoccaceae bacterium 1502E]|nr:GntR family transcriptional regulator [Geminicoccaceae bacterium 1502E]